MRKFLVVYYNLNVHFSLCSIFFGFHMTHDDYSIFRCHLLTVAIFDMKQTKQQPNNKKKNRKKSVETKDIITHSIVAKTMFDSDLFITFYTLH